MAEKAILTKNISLNRKVFCMFADSVESSWKSSASPGHLSHVASFKYD